MIESKTLSSKMEKVEWKVEGMTCANCALTISKYLNKQGLKEVKVNVLDGDVSFNTSETIEENIIKKGIEGLGYKVVNPRDILIGGSLIETGTVKAQVTCNR